METQKNLRGRHTLLISMLVLTLSLIGYSLCLAGVGDQQVTQIAIQGNTIIITVYNPTPNSETVRYSASAILADLTEETGFSEVFTIDPEESLLVSIGYSTTVVAGGGDDPTPWPWP
jgi:hypothetical protein